MKPLYPLIGRITWILSKRAAKQKLPKPPSRKKVVAGITTALLTAGAVAALRRRGSDRLV